MVLLFFLYATELKVQCIFVWLNLHLNLDSMFKDLDSNTS